MAFAWGSGLMVKMASRLSLVALSMVIGLHGPVQAQGASGGGVRYGLICRDGEEFMEFVFDGKGSARLTRIEGAAVSTFSDLHEPDWTVRIVAENGASLLRMTNSRGVILSMSAPSPDLPETVGHMTWNNPPGAKADLLCDLKTVAL